MEATKRVPWRDLSTGLGSALVGYLVMTVLTITTGLGSLGPLGFVILITVGILVTVGTYALVTPGDIPATKRMPWTILINGLGSAYLGYVVGISFSILLGLDSFGPLGTLVSIGLGLVVAVGSYLVLRRL